MVRDLWMRHSPFTRFLLQIIPKGLCIFLVNETGWDIDELVIWYHALVLIMNGIEHFNGLVTIHVGILNNRSMNRSIQNALEDSSASSKATIFTWLSFPA